MNWIQDRLRKFDQQPIALSDSGVLTYADFIHRIEQWRYALAAWGVGAGDRVAVIADYHINVLALFQALVNSGCVVIPLSAEDKALFEERLTVVSANRVITVRPQEEPFPDTADCRTLDAPDAMHPLLSEMVDAARPGFVIFTSGSTGKGKAVLLDHARMTRKFQSKIRPAFRTLLFLKLDHIGGLNTLLSVILNGGCVVGCQSRQAKDICACIEKHAVELLPTTPSFLTMMLMSGVFDEYDLSSLKVITYGTEVMPASTLESLHRRLPHVVLKQTYGLSELGIMSTKSRDSSSKWMKIGGEGVDVRVQDGTLWIRSDQAMLGYLNAPSPFDGEGWYNTGDKVEVDGEYFRILGRESEIINVAGEKVFPGELESFLLTLDNVKDVLVRSKKSPVVGQMIWAEFLLEAPEDPASFKKRVIERCQADLAPFKVPGFITIAQGETLVGSRFKKIRKTHPSSAEDKSASTSEPA